MIDSIYIYIYIYIYIEEMILNIKDKRNKFITYRKMLIIYTMFLCLKNRRVQ